MADQMQATCLVCGRSWLVEYEPEPLDHDCGDDAEVVVELVAVEE